LSIVDAGSGQMAIAILMQSFLFEKALMQEHFNENYVESDLYPKATFKGKIIDFEKIGISERKVQVIGMLKMHGETKEVTIDALAKKTTDAILMTGEFYINLADFAVAIPSIVRNKISQKIKVSFQFNHKPYK
jgi:polyisoprenoid-binding protein YceI